MCPSLREFPHKKKTNAAYLKITADGLGALWQFVLQFTKDFFYFLRERVSRRSKNQQLHCLLSLYLL